MSAVSSQSLFQEELRELLSELDVSLLDLERDSSSEESINRIFRALHTIKGSCDMFGLARAMGLLHDLESLWDKARAGLTQPSRRLLDLTFSIKDRMEHVAENVCVLDPDPELSFEMAAMAETGAPAPTVLMPGASGGSAPAAQPFASGAGSSTGPESNPGADASGAAHPQTVRRLYRVRLAPSDEDHFRKMDPGLLLEALGELGPTAVTADTSGVPGLEELDPACCLLRWEALLETASDPDTVRDVFMFLDNPGDVSVEDVTGRMTMPSPSADLAGDSVSPRPSPADAGLFDVWRGFAAEAGMADARQAVASGGHEAARSPSPPVADRNAARRGEPTQTATPHHVPEASASAPAAASADPASASAPAGQSSAQARGKTKEAAQSLRVEAAKLDNLVNLVGELVIAQARLTQVSQGLGNSELTGVAEEIERLVGELRDNTLGIRMLPIGTTFSRFRRLVRDLSAELGKEIDLVADGGETELDKTVIEQLGDPLVHLLRNSIDHGIESPEARLEAGKSARGVIRLSAKQAGGAVIIRIADDGRGLDTARILAKAVERGIVGPDARLSPQETHQLIFAPGFSTAEKVTSVSGRGVGMDVVKSSIEALRGVVDIESEPGKGSAITISLPLTLAIIDGLQVRTGGDFYIIPLAIVEECVEVGGQTRRPDTSKAHTLSIRGEIVPYIRLRETFLLGGQPPAMEQVVVTRHENGRTGIAVDEVIGQQQTVIKNLGRLIGRVEGISGATINGDGSMALILDVPQLVSSVQREVDQL